MGQKYQEFARLRRATRQRGLIDALEPRTLLCVDHGPLGTTGIVLLPSEPPGGGTIMGPDAPAGSVPALSSRPGATAKLFLDFDGADPMSWGTYSVPSTPAYDIDGVPAAFSATELSNIQQIWSRVAEAYSPFNLDVTTVDPGTLADRVALRAVIGGTGSWYGSAGGVAYVGGFYNGANNNVFIFSKNLANGQVKYTADAIAHESGHGFGLYHQSTWSGSTKTNEYNPGNAARAPIMGNSYSAARALWWSGTSSQSATTLQHDVDIISNGSNGFGYRPDDHLADVTSATPLAVSGSTFSAAGVIERVTDQDWFSFSTLAGTVTFRLAVATHGPMLDATLALLNSAGAAILTADTTSLGETISTTLTAGQYFLAVKSKGLFGDVGQYSLSGTIVTSPDYVAAPTGLAASVAGGQVVLTWTDMSWNESGFQVDRSEDGGGTWTTVAMRGPNVATWTDPTVAIGSVYHYRVRALGSPENSSWAALGGVTVTPAAPSGLGFSGISSSSLTLSWASTSGASGYRVERSLNGTTWTQISLNSLAETEYSDTGLAAATRYYYRVRAMSAAGDGPWSAAASTFTTTVAPTTLSAVTGESSIALSWANITGESAYKVYRSADDGLTWTHLTTTGANIVSFTDAGLAANARYLYRVSAVNGGGESAFSPQVTATTLLPAPFGLSATVLSETQIRLTWADSSGESGYRIERLAGSTWGPVGASLPSDTTAFTVTGLSPGVGYAYRVRAINAGGFSTPSTTVSAVTIPPAPVVTAAATSTSSIQLTWPSVPGETAYHLDRSTNGTDWVRVSTLPASATGYSDAGLGTDARYFYRVRAANAAGSGQFCSPVQARTLLPAPTGAAAVAFSTTRIDLSWEDAETEIGYRIEKQTGSGWTPVGATLPAGTNSYSVTGLNAGTGYAFRVRALNDGGWSAPSTVASALTIPAAPLKPVAASTAHTSIKLSWTNVTGETAYRVDRSIDGENWTTAVTTSANVTAWTDNTLSPDTNYYYRVRAANASGAGDWSEVVSCRTLLAPVTGFSASADSQSQVTLRWNDASGEIGYRVERRSGTSWIVVATLAPQVTSMSVAGLSSGTSHAFRISAINAGGNSIPVTASAWTMPAAPTALAATLSGATVRLSWRDVAGETGYRIERSINGGAWVQIGVTGANSLIFNDAVVASGAFSYRVSAFNVSGFSLYSTPVTRWIG